MRNLLLTLGLAAFSAGCNFGAYPPVHTFPNVKVQFINARDGWIIGPRLLRTHDGGNSWKPIRSDGPGTIVTEVVDNEQRCIQFVNERVGFFLERSRRIYKTLDGGETWTEVASPLVTDETERFHTILFISPSKGWILGKYVYRTDDGTLSWTRLGTTPVADDTRVEKPAVAEGYPPAVALLNGRNMVLVRKDGDVYRSEDGGAKWHRVWSVNNFLCNVYFVNDNAGWIVGANGFVGRTTDGGASWEQTKPPTTAQFNDIFFLNYQKGWAVGRDGAIIYTTDGGTSWTTAPLSAEFKLNLVDVFFIDEKRGWVVGGKPFDDIDFSSQPSNLILETQDGGQTWTTRNL